MARHGGVECLSRRWDGPSSFYTRLGDSLVQALTLFWKTETRVAAALNTEGHRKKGPQQLVPLVRGARGGRELRYSTWTNPLALYVPSDRATL